MDWDKLRVFHWAAETGSFTRAGETLNMSQSAISRKIAALEDSLKTVLFYRHARGIVLTEQGELLRKTVRDVFEKIERAEIQLTDSKGLPRGELTVTAPTGLGTTWLARHIRDFLRLYPDIQLQLLLTDDEVDLSQRRADVAVRLHKSTQGSLIQRPLMTVHNHLYASREYISEHGMPARPEDLDHHDLVVYGPEVPVWLKGVNWAMEVGSGEKRRQPVLRVNNVSAVLRAVKAGIGVAIVPDYLAEGSGLVRVLPKIDPPSFSAYYVYPESLRQSKRIAVFRDFLLDKVASTGF